MEMFLTSSNTLTPQDIELYYKLNEQAKDLKKKLDLLKTKIKSTMLDNNIDVINTGEYTACLTNSTKKRVDEDKLVEMLYNKGLYSTLQIVRKPLYTEIEMCIASGLLHQEEYNECVGITFINNLNVKHN